MTTDTMPRTPGTIRRAPAPGGAMPPGRRTPPRGTMPRAPRPVTAPRHTRPISGARTTPHTPRMPFILLLVGLLGGALVTLLMISTTLAEGSFQITSLQQQNANLARQEQVLTEQVAQAQSPAQIAQEAARLGMLQDPRLLFIDLKTGKIVTGKISRADAEINVPGYYP